MSAVPEGAAVEKENAPDPEDPRKPDSPTDLTPPSWWYTARMAFAEFKRDQCTDLAAALTYYAVFAALPSLVVMMAIVGLVGDPQETTNTIIDLIESLGQDDIADDLRGPIESIVDSRKAGLALIFGAVIALWSASGYVSAFGRAMNRIYEIDEGRPWWKLRAINLVVTLVSLVSAAILVVSLTVSGPVAEEIGDKIGASDAVVTLWTYGRWPLMLLVTALMVAVLYYVTPNVQQPRFRWVSMGAGLAMLIWIAGSIGFSLYVNSFASYDRTYGSLAGAIVALLWLNITNLALLFGAEFDSEMERARELQAGMRAEETLQLPPRDTTASDKAAAKHAEDVERGRALRRRARHAVARKRATQNPHPHNSRAGRALGALVLLAAAQKRAQPARSRRPMH